LFDVGFSKVAMPVCIEFTYREIARRAWLEGAKILFDASWIRQATHLFSLRAVC
jgi:hypothetical protein